AGLRRRFRTDGHGSPERQRRLLPRRPKRNGYRGGTGDARGRRSAGDPDGRGIGLLAAPYQHLAFADMVGGAAPAFLLHLLDALRRGVVADLQVPLDEAGARLALARDEIDRLVEQPLLALARERRQRPVALVGNFGDLLDIGRLALLPEEGDDLFH